MHNRPDTGMGGLYGRTEGRQDIKRTYIQGMKPREEKVSSQGKVLPEERAVRIKLQPRPVAGVLYSVSRDVCGEIFPVYLGRNTIGCTPESDIYLNEETVSPNHAVLLIRQLQDEYGNRKVTMNITDYDSDFGTAVNGVKLGYDRESLKGNEIIQIGNAYYFIFVPLDPVPFGLGQVSGFMSTPRQDAEPTISNRPGSDEYLAPTPNEPIYPSSVGEADERTFYARSFAKKEDHSAKKTINN